MKTVVREVYGIAVEEPVLDTEGRRARDELVALIDKVYGETGALMNCRERDEVRDYEEFIVDHVTDPEEE